jgi:hypothetical protein
MKGFYKTDIAELITAGIEQKSEAAVIRFFSYTVFPYSDGMQSDMNCSYC